MKTINNTDIQKQVQSALNQIEATGIKKLGKNPKTKNKLQKTTEEQNEV